MLIEMPDLGSPDGKQAASLAGLEPISRRSGKCQGHERIQGGRTFLRRAIYIPGLAAVRFNRDLKAKFDQLIASGKPANVALVAIMRKLIVLTNAELNRTGFAGGCLVWVLCRQGGLLMGVEARFGFGGWDVSDRLE